MPKADDYANLVLTRKACHACTGLTNPHDVEDGRYDSDHAGPWSRWQGNLDAQLMVVGQDWGTPLDFVRQDGHEGPHSPTNLALVELVATAGIRIGAPGLASGRNITFFTNAILCLKSSEGGLQGRVQPAWFVNCATFLRRQIEIVSPRVVVGLGERAYRTVLRSFGILPGAFRAEVERANGRSLPNGSRPFAVYHCGAWIQHTHRPLDLQKLDWMRLRPYLENAG